MHFASLILAFSAASVASATAIVKRGDFHLAFHDLDAATEAADYITYQLVATTDGKAQALSSSGEFLILLPDCLAACEAVSGCTFANSKSIANSRKARD
ncbi:hypothetical protein F5887DRAFT_957115 [Amanita rubescens]|nr:hypothetical protein F5887DRAFT_957115 [Amanita rubescens]